MRNYQHIDSYLNKFLKDVYEQPEGNDKHSALAYRVIQHWMSRLTGCNSVLDVGCGAGFASEYFGLWNVQYEGVALGEDFIVARDKGRNVKKMDFTFLDYEDNSFDLIFSRHSIEHSVAPLLTLCEWHRVSKQWLGLVVPTIEWYGVKGRNHYYVLTPEQWENLLNNAGWNVIWSETDSIPKDEKEPDVLTPHEHWIFCEKKH